MTLALSGNPDGAPVSASVLNYQGYHLEPIPIRMNNFSTLNCLIPALNLCTLPQLVIVGWTLSGNPDGAPVQTQSALSWDSFMSYVCVYFDYRPTLSVHNFELMCNDMRSVNIYCVSGNLLYSSSLI